MPKAVVDPSEAVKKELKTLPASADEEAGYVILRRMTYGQKKHRQEMASKQALQIEGREATQMDIAIIAHKVAIYEFKHCIVKHNLQDAEGNLLDFSNENTIDTLHPQVGDEIDMYISELNNFEEEDQAKNS